MFFFVHQTEGYFLSSDCASLTTTCIDHGLAQTTNVVSKADPTANLTFDLHLSAKEKEARSQVVLPYTSVQEEGGLVGIASHTGSARIFYEPDEEDCFGDSDPDDDLDI